MLYHRSSCDGGPLRSHSLVVRLAEVKLTPD